jgi:hypothetical protein
MLHSFLTRPGFHTSEWLVAIGSIAWYILNAWQDYTTTTGAVTYSLPALVYIVSRGLAKYEARNTSAPPPPPTA